MVIVLKNINNMDASIRGVLSQLDKRYRVFEHKGVNMTKEQVKLVLNYGIMKGYRNISEITDEEVDKLIFTNNG